MALTAAGNVMFHDGLPPLVIDLSPYWPPPLFATAIVAADALVFRDADAGLVNHLLSGPEDPGGHEFPQHLLHALIYRVVTDLVTEGTGVPMVACSSEEWGSATWPPDA